MYHNIYVKRTDYNKYQVHLWDSEKGYQTFEWQKHAYILDPHGEYNTLDGKRARKTTFWTKNDIVYEADVPAETALLLELYGDSDESPSWQNKFYFDIEVEMSGDDLPDPMRGNNTITSIAYYDQTSDEWGVYILDEKGELGEGDKNSEYNLVICGTERELLNKFLTKWKECNPTVITGWNINGFDIPYLYNRMAVVLGKGVANTLSPIGVVKWNKNIERFRIAGVSALDYIELYKQFTYTQLSSYRLDYVGNHELGYGKIEYTGTLDDLKRNDIRKFIEYNIVDVKIVKELEDKLKFMDLAIDISHVGHTPYEYIDRSSRWLEGAILCYIRRNGNRVAMNKPPKIEKEEGEKGFAGAFVKEPVPGRYDYIYDLDLTSMYPSIIMSLNISPETKFGKVYDWDFEKYHKGEIDKLIVHIFSDGRDIEIDRESFKEMLEETGHSISSNGILYRTDVDGVLPSILNDWFDKRSEYKKLMKKFGNEGVDDKYRFYKQRQLIQKVLLNSIYGVLGLPGFRMYDLDNALAVTSVGQQVIKFSASMANHYYTNIIGKGIPMETDEGVVYGFTNIEYTIDRNGIEEKCIGSELEEGDYIKYGYVQAIPNYP